MTEEYRRVPLSVILRDDTSVKELEANEKGELLFTQGLPPYTEMSRLGNGFSGIATAAVAALVDRPSTTAAVTLWNGENAGGKSYIIDRAFTHQLVSTAVEARACIWICVHPIGMTKPATSPIAASAKHMVGHTGNLYNGRGVFDIGLGCVDNGWYPWGGSVSIETVGILAGAQISVDIKGRIIIPPTAGISIQVVASLTGDTFCSGLSWYEARVDL